MATQPLFGYLPLPFPLNVQGAVTTARKQLAEAEKTLKEKENAATDAVEGQEKAKAVKIAEATVQRSRAGIVTAQQALEQTQAAPNEALVTVHDAHLVRRTRRSGHIDRVDHLQARLGEGLWFRTL